jgi:spermidine synthase
MGAEMLVLFTFQVMFGYLYLKVGAIITAFLMGLLPGAALGNLRRKGAPRPLVLSDLFILALLLAFYFWITFFETDLHPIYFLAYGFVFSLFCGYQFPLVTALIGEKESPAAGCLAADLTGAAVGTLATGTLLIPLLGIHRAIIFLILVKISSNIILLFMKGRRGAWSAG